MYISLGKLHFFQNDKTFILRSFLNLFLCFFLSFQPVVFAVNFGNDAKVTENVVLYKDKCIEALNSPKIDSADYILLTTQILFEILNPSTCSEISKKIQEIAKAFLLNNYKESYAIINELLLSIKEKNEDLYSMLMNRQHVAKQNDIPEKNQTRRYFETKLATELWKEQITSEQSKHNQFKSIERLSAVLTEEVGEMVEADEREIAVQIEYSRKFYLPVVVNSQQECLQVIQRVHGICDYVKHVHNKVQKLKDAKAENEEHNLYSTKDRNSTKLTTVTHSEYYTCNTGILRANSPMPQDERFPYDSLGVNSTLLQGEGTFENKIVDIFRINRGFPNGYSRTHTTVPFVNSLSGSAYALVVFLIDYVEKYKIQLSHAELENDINNLVNCFIAFTCKNGYHSIMEMYDVLTDVAVKSFFEKNNIRLHLFSDTSISKAIEAAMQYSIATNIGAILHNQINEMTKPLLKRRLLTLQSTEDKKHEHIGPREISGWILEDVNDIGNCFYEAVIDQMRIINHSFMNEVPITTDPHTLLRSRIQTRGFRDGAWADYPEIIALAMRFNIIIGIVDTRSPENGILYHYIDGNGVPDFTRDINALPSNQSIIRLAYTGNHYLSVRASPNQVEVSRMLGIILAEYLVSLERLSVLYFYWYTISYDKC